MIERYRLPAYVTGLGAKGSVIYSTRPVREYRDSIGIDERITYLAWLYVVALLGLCAEWLLRRRLGMR